MQNGYEAYQRIKLETASKPQLLLALYDSVLRFLGRAQAAVAKRDVEKAHHDLVRSQEIITELMSTLDPDYGEIPQQLLELYIYLYGALTEANLRKDAAKIAEAEAILRQLRDGWRVAVAQCNAEAAQSDGGSAQAGG